MLKTKNIARIIYGFHFTQSLKVRAVITSLPIFNVDIGPIDKAFS
ncbi:Protein of unknown function [Bacillus wiedmannii]|uniref:Uncharacterized protein n=2 Tax=Bacillus cereus group TaxID=86661 RepID=A0A1C3ZNY5_BACTU|nr:Protein of unknown function [Bacillus wiedmannii]SCB84043.1 Protein of unknown function [Bacillus thuringiensis]